MSTSLANLITLVRQRSNMEANYFVTDDELTTYINNSLGELDDLLTTEYEDYRLNTFLAVLQDGYNEIAIPSTMNKLRGVDVQLTATPGQEQWQTLFSFQFTQRNRGRNALSDIVLPYGRANLSYRLADQGIIIMPLTQAAGTYQIWFTPKFNPLLVSTDILPIQMDTQAWVEYAIVDVCIKVLNKQNLDPSGFMAEKQALLVRIKGAAKNRDAAGPKKIANTRYMDDNWFGYGFDGNGSGW